MPVIFNISFRNLVRQKRRNILLGIAIAFGAMVLIVANAFSHGISKVLFEQVVRYTNGHVAVSYMRNGSMTSQVFYDDERIRDAVRQAAPGALRTEEAIGVFARAIGNGIADYVIMVGVDLSEKLTPEEKKEFTSNFKMLQGSFLSLNDKSVECPVALSEQKAKYLRVKIGDVLRVRFTGVNNESSSARLTVVGIFKPANIFMSSSVFLELHDIKTLAGYGPHDIAAVHIVLKDPQRNAKAVADRLHDRLKPCLAVMTGSGTLKGKAVLVTVLGFRADSTSQAIMRRNVSLSAGDSAAAFGYRGIIIAKELAAQCRAGIGDTLSFSWDAKYGSDKGHANFVITAVINHAAKFPANGIFVNEHEFYHAYYEPLPAAPAPELLKTLPDSSDPLYAALAPEFMLMKRCATTDEYAKMSEEMGRGKFKGIMVSVGSMYETASAILQVEAALNVITLVAGLILFFIILIGVVNTLRMTIRERTREIGTVRAIGMQRSQVLNMFLLETLFLAFFASVVGAIAAFAAMWGLSSFTIEATDNPMGILLVKGHLFFAPTAGSIAVYIVFIMVIAVATAYFPARRAAKLTAAYAMRHYE
jgi:ABC-type lipoprotein release transport system permease subunit